MGFAMHQRKAKLAGVFYTIVTIYVIGLSVFVFFPQWYLRDLLINFVPYILLLHVPFLLGIILLFSGFTNKKMHRYFCFLIVFSMTLQTSVCVRPYLHSPRSFASHQGNMIDLKVISANVLYENTDYQKTIDLIEQEKPDVFGLVELTGEFANAMKIVDDRYPYQLTAPAPNGFGLGLYSRFELKNAALEHYSDGIPFITALVEKNHKEVHLLLTHVMTPITPSTYEERNESLQMLGKEVNPDETTIVMGDFNLTPWSHFYQQFIQDTNLVNLRNAKNGLQMSWFGYGFYLPIDHLFISRDITPLEFTIGPDIGSDHRPIIAEIAF